MKEKRRSPRFPVRGLDGTLLYNIDAKILNLGLTGMALATSSALRVGHAYSLTLGAGIGSMRLSGVVAWCRLARTRKTESGDTAPVFEAGIRFEGMLSERAEQLLHLLEENAIISLETRVAGRFRLPDQDEPVQIESQVEFEVVKLSASGMLIECDAVVAAETVLVADFNLPRAVVHATCRVASVLGGDAGGGRRQFGLEFLELADEHRSAIDAFITEELQGAEAGAEAGPEAS